jgi:hypothetical protein
VTVSRARLFARASRPRLSTSSSAAPLVADAAAAAASKAEPLLGGAGGGRRGRGRGGRGGGRGRGAARRLAAFDERASAAPAGTGSAASVDANDRFATVRGLAGGVGGEPRPAAPAAVRFGGAVAVPPPPDFLPGRSFPRANILSAMSLAAMRSPRSRSTRVASGGIARSWHARKLSGSAACRMYAISAAEPPGVLDCAVAPICCQNPARWLLALLATTEV